MANQIKFKVGFDVDKTNLNQLKSSLQQIQKLSISDVMKINNTNPTQAKEALTKIKEQAKNVEIALKTAFNVKLNTINIEKFNQSLKGSSSSIEQVYKAFKGAGAAGENTFRSLSAQVLSTNIQLKQTHSLLDKMAITFANTIKWNISSAVFNTMTNSIQQAWNFTKALDSSLNDIRIVTGKSADEMADFAVKANEAARSLGKSTKDYTNASLIYAQQGLSDKEIQARTNITLKTANVTGQAASDVSEQLTAVWNSYRVGAEEAEIYVDRLAAVAAKSASNLEELSRGMSKVASAAATMGVSEEQLAAQLSTIISVTRQAPQTVGTALKTVYARITDIQAGLDSETSLGNYSGKMAEFGINVLDANNKLRDMGEVIEEIGGKWSTMTREQQIALTQTMGGQRQYSNLIALFDSFDKYNEMMQIAANAQGTLQKQQDTYMQRTTAHLQQLSTAAENLYMNLIDNDSINGLVDGLTTVIGLTTTWVQSIGGLGTLLTGLGGIGLNVFSEQIAKGINTMISNSEKANSNVKQIEDSLQEVQKWQGIPELDNFTKQLLDSRQQMLELAHLMSPEQFSGIQNTLNDLTQAGNAVAELAEKREKLNKIVEETFKNNSRVNGLEQALANPSQQKIIMERFQQYETRLDNFKKFVGQSFKAIKKLNIEIIDEKDIGSFKSKVEAINKEFETIFKKNKFNRNLIPQSQIANFEKLENKFNSLKTQLAKPNADVGKIARELQMVYAQISGIINNSAHGMEQTIADLAKFFEGGSDEISKALDQAITKAESFKAQLEVAARTELIQGFSQLGGSILQIGSAIQQIQNLGSIWQNNDLSTGEKILQTFIALGTTIPTLVTGLNSFKQAIDLLNQSEKTRAELGKVVAVTEELEAKKSKEAAAANVAETVSNKAEEASEEGLTAAKLKEQLATGKATTASGLHTAAQTVETAATGILTGAVEALSLALSTLAANPILLVIGGAAAIIGGITAAVTAYNKSIETTIEKNNQIINQANKTQEEISSNEQLYDSMEDLNNQFKSGLISRHDLKAGIADLLKEYKVEDQNVKTLTTDYDKLTQAIKKQRAEKFKEAKESSLGEYRAAKENVEKSAYKNVGYRTGDTNQISIDAGWLRPFSAEDIGKETLKFLSNIKEFQWYDNGNDDSFGFSIDRDADSLLKFYDQLLEAQRIANKQGSELPERLTTWLADMKEPIQAMKKSIPDIIEWSSKLAEIDLSLDFENIDNVADYQQQKTQLIKALQEDKDIQKEGLDAKTLGQAYLTQEYTNQVVRFEEAAKLYQSIVKKAEMSNDLWNSWRERAEDIKEIFSNFDENQLDLLIKLKPDTISTWENFRNIATQILGMDLFNTKDILTGYTDEVGEAAYQKYKSLQDVEDQIKNSKNISKSQYENLIEIDKSFNAFFRKMANGTYKFIGKADEFNKLVDSMKLEDFESAIATINEEVLSLGGLKSFEQGNVYDYDVLSGEKNIPDYLGISDEQKPDVLAKRQLEYLDAVATTNSALQVEVNLWKDLLEKGNLADQQYKAITERVQEVGDKTKNLDQQAIHLIEQKQKLLEQYNEALDPLDEDIDTKQFNNLVDYLIETNKLFKNNRLGAEDYAEAILRFNDAIQDVTKNYDDWVSALKKGTLQDQAKAAAELKDAYGDLLDIDGSNLSNTFLTSTKNLELLKQAANGSEKAYNQLLDAASQDINARLNIDSTKLPKTRAAFEELIMSAESFDGKEITIGAKLDDAEYIDALNKMVAQAGWAQGQITDYLEGMGYDAELQTVTQAEPTKKQYHNLIPHVEWETASGSGLPGAGDAVYNTNYRFPIVTYEDQPVEIGEVQENTASAVRIKSLSKKAGGNIKYKHSNKGVGSGSKKSKGSGKKGGGGSGSKADTSQKDLKKPLEDERDIYHDINIEIEQINRELERTQKTQDKLYGKQLLDNLNKQSQILENHKAKLKEKQKIQQQDLKTQQDILKSLKVTFDAYGNISNYMDILAQKQVTINQLTEEYNKLVKQYNASTNKDTKTKINEKIEAKSKEIQEAEDARKNLEDKIKKYDDLRETMEDLIDEIEDETQQQIEIAITKFRMQLEIRLELGEAERDWNEFKRKVLNHTDIIKDSDFSKLFKDTQQSVEDLLSYFNAGTVTKLTEQLSDTKAEIEAIDKIGESAIYGKNKTQAMEDLKSDLDTLTSQLEDIQDLVDSIDEVYLNTIDDIKDGFDEQIKDYELITELLEHDVDLLTLLYGEKNYDAMNKYYSSLQENQNKQIDSLRQQRDFWKAEWDATVARGDTAAAQKFKGHYTEALKNLNSAIQTAAQTLQDKYTNAIDKIFDELDKRISDNKGIDYLELEWELMNKNSDEYLDTINSAFKLQDLQTKFTKALNDTKSLKGQREIKKLMDEQLKNLKAKDKLTEYDVQRAEKLLQIEQARIALEDAQASKTTMRLKRDAQGNYSYQFVANNDKVLEAQQNLANTQNDLYNFDKEKYQSNLNDMMSAWKDFQSQYKEIQLDTSLTEEQRTKKLALLREKYEKYINNKVAENQTIRNNLRDSAFADYAALYGADVEAYQKMSDKEKDILMSELVPAWDSGIQQMVGVFSKEGGFTGVTEEAFKNLDKVAKDYASDLQALFSNAGVNVDSLKGGADDTVESFNDLVEKNDDLIGRMKTELTAIEDLRKGVKELMNQYNAAYESAKKMVSVIYQFNKKQQQEAADTAKKEATTKPVTPVSTTASSSTASSSTTSSKISTSTTTSKTGTGNGQGSSSGVNSNKTKIKGSINKNGGNLKDQAYEKMKQLESQILKYENSFNSAKNHIPAQALKASYLSPVLKLQKELNSIIKNVQKTNLKDAQKLQTKADTSVKDMQQYIKKVTNPSSVANNRTTGIATSQYGLLQPTNTLEKHTIGKDSFGQWISSNPSFFKKINTFYIENYLGSIWKNYKTHRKYTQYYDSKKKRYFIDVGSFDTGGYTGNWADQQGRLALLHKKELVLNSSDTENMLTMINITREILKNLNSNVFMRTSKIGSLTPKNNNANDTIEQNVRIEASFPNVDSKREIEEAFNDLVNLAAQRALQ